MKFSHVLMAAGLALSGFVAHAEELDPIAVALPRQLVVKVDEKTGEKTVLKAYNDTLVAGDKDAEAVALSAEADGEAVVAQPMSELDRDSSQAAWYYYYQQSSYYSYGYSYGYYGSYYSYSSYYSYYSYSNNCRYYYYRR